MALKSNCEDCPCKFEVIKLCELVPKCTTTIRIFIGELPITVYTYYSLVLFRFLDRAEINIEFFKYQNGFLYFDIPNRFLNVFGDAQYMLYLQDIFSNEKVCISFNCEKTKAIIFEVGNCTNTNTYSITDKCSYINIECTTNIELYKVLYCTTKITLCQSKLKCETFIKF